MSHTIDVVSVDNADDPHPIEVIPNRGPMLVLSNGRTVVRVLCTPLAFYVRHLGPKGSIVSMFIYITDMCSLQFRRAIGEFAYALAHRPGKHFGQMTCSRATDQVGPLDNDMVDDKSKTCGSGIAS